MLLLLLHGFFDPGQVVGDAGIDPRGVVMPEGNDALRHLIAHQGPARITLRTDETSCQSLCGNGSHLSQPAQALPSGPAYSCLP